MENHNNDDYISQQISVYKTNKKLCEFIDKLNPAPINNYASLHANGTKVDNSEWKIYSKIGIVLQDYSKGTGENIVRVIANISPEEIRYIFSRLNLGVTDFCFEQDKVFGEPDENGFSIVTKLSIKRADKSPDKNGEMVKRTYPWQIMIDNGKGRKEKTSTGGFVFKQFQSEKRVAVFFNDIDLFILLSKVTRYLELWEIASCIGLIKRAKEELEKIKEQNRLKIVR